MHLHYHAEAQRLIAKIEHPMLLPTLLSLGMGARRGGDLLGMRAAVANQLDGLAFIARAEGQPTQKTCSELPGGDQPIYQKQDRRGQEHSPQAGDGGS